MQILAVHEGHRDELETLDLAQIVDAEDVLVRDLRPEEQLLLEPLDGGRIGHEPGANDLDRDHPVELAVVGLVDAAHAAFAEQGLDVVAGAQLRAGLDVECAPRPVTIPRFRLSFGKAVSRSGHPMDESEKVTSASENGRCECGGSESRGPGNAHLRLTVAIMQQGALSHRTNARVTRPDPRV